VSTTTLPTSLLTTLDTLKTVLGISGSTEDDYLNYLIKQASSQVEGYCTRVLGRVDYETTVSIFRGDASPSKILLRLYPDVVVTSVKCVDSDGVSMTLDSDGYLVDDGSGVLTLTSASIASINAYAADGEFKVITVDHTGAYYLPEDVANRNLPEAIEAATIELCKSARYSRDQDPSIRSETVPDVLQVSYFAGGGGSGSHETIMSGLDIYRDMRIF